MAKILVAAKDLASGVVKGDIVEVYPDSYGWGNKEGLPNFIRLEITNRTKEQADVYLQQVVKAFDYSIDAQNASGVRGTISVDQTLSGDIDKEVKQELKDYILDGAGADVPVSQVSQTSESLTVDITLPDDENRTPTLQGMKDNVNDRFQQVIGYRRYFFNPIQVDVVVAAGGSISVTAAQASPNLIDRFA